MTDSQVYYQNPKTGEIHRAILSEGSRFTDERCNLDQADEVEIKWPDAEAILFLDPDKACGHCLKGAQNDT